MRILARTESVHVLALLQIILRLFIATWYQIVVTLMLFKRNAALFTRKIFSNRVCLIQLFVRKWHRNEFVTMNSRFQLQNPYTIQKIHIVCNFFIAATLWILNLKNIVSSALSQNVIWVSHKLPTFFVGTKWDVSEFQKNHYAYLKYIKSSYLKLDNI